MPNQKASIKTIEQQRIAAVDSDSTEDVAFKSHKSSPQDAMAALKVWAKLAENGDQESLDNYSLGVRIYQHTDLISQVKTCNPNVARTTAPKYLKAKKEPSGTEKKTYRGTLNKGELAEGFKWARESKGLTFRAAGKAANRDHAVFSKLENGQLNMSAKKLSELADALGYEIFFELTPKDVG